MSKTKDKVPVLKDLGQAYKGSYYTILGCAGDLSEWVEGVTGLLKDADIGTPEAFYQTSGLAVNEYATRTCNVKEQDLFQNDLTILMFPLDGLHIGKLAIFKLQMGDRWFDDVIDNMRSEPAL